MGAEPPDDREHGGRGGDEPMGQHGHLEDDSDAGHGPRVTGGIADRRRGEAYDAKAEPESVCEAAALGHGHGDVTMGQDFAGPCRPEVPGGIWVEDEYLDQERWPTGGVAAEV